MSAREVAIMLAMIGFLMGCGAVYGFVSAVVTEVIEQLKRSRDA